MRQSILFNEAVDGGDDVGMAGHIVERIWSVFLDPETCQNLSGALCCGTYHGRLSCASTGRSAVMRLPLPAVLSELN